MATTVGPLFAVWVDTPAEWRHTLGLKDSECVIRSRTQGQAWVVDLVSKTLKAKLGMGQESWIYLAQIMREDGQSLFAFETAGERALFIELREIDSIGSKYAAAAVSEIGMSGVNLILKSASLPPLKVPGLGPKTLEKIRVGIKARPEVFAKILQGQSFQAAPSAVSSGAAADQSAVQTLAVATVQGTASSYLMVPDLILQALSNLGLKTHDILKLYQDCSEAHSGFAQFAVGDQVKHLLARWGHYKKNLRPEMRRERTAEGDPA